MSSDAFTALLGSHRGTGDAADARHWVERYGPNGEVVRLHIDRCARLSPEEMAALGTAWDKAWDSQGTMNHILSALITRVWNVAEPAAFVEAVWRARREAENAVGAETEHPRAVDAALAAVRTATDALLIGHLISDDDFHALYRPWADVFDWPAAYFNRLGLARE